MAGATRTVTVRLACGDDEALFERIEVARGGLPREVWMREAFESALGGGDARIRYERQPGPNVENIRSSDQVKRSIGPIPKQGKK